MAEMDRFTEEVGPMLRSRVDRDGGGKHVSAEEIVSYHQKDLSPARHALVQEHLAKCGECAELLLDLANFEDLELPPGHAASDVPDFAALKRSLDERLLAEARSAMGSAIPVAPRSHGFRYSGVYWATLAAFLVIVAGLGLQMRLSSAPRAGTTETFLLHPETYRSGGQQSFEVPIWAEVYVLTLGSVKSLGLESVTAEILDLNGKVVVKEKALHRASDGTFKWSLSRTRLPSGTYQVRLFGSRSEPLDAYQLMLNVEELSD